MKTHKRSLTHFNITTVDAGYVYPIGHQEVIPGDTFQAATSALIRMQPMNAPVMHPYHARIMHFFVPNRLCWDNWEDFITNASSTAVFPTVPASVDADALTIENYMGATAAVSTTYRLNALPRRAYNLIWNEYFRDQDLQDPAAISLADGADDTTNGLCLRASWKKDQLTTARPFAAKGPQVTIPVQSSGSLTSRVKADVGSGSAVSALNSSDSYQRLDTSAANLVMSATAGTEGSSLFTTASQSDLESLLYTLPNDIRVGIACQQWQEIAARYGSRYTEYLRARFGVIAQDSRLQRPEYLAGGEATIQMSEVLQTSNPGTVTDLEDAVASLKGHGIGSVKSNAFRRFFPEHGQLITVLVVRPIPIYTDAPSRFFLKNTMFDFYTKEFAHIGSAEVKKGEARLSDADPYEPWGGFQDQYYDYRSRKNYISGKIRNTFNYWTEARIFSSDPVLNESFIQCIPSDRIFAAPVDQNFVVMVHNKCVVRGQVAPVGSTSNL